MPRGGGRGGKRSHKGEHRRFTGFEELAAQSKEIEKDKERGDREEAPEGGYRDPEKGSDSDSESSSDDEGRGKGVSNLIEIENPNRVQKKSSRKVTELDTSSETSTKAQLSRREREELQKQQARADYMKRHQEGKTDEARADLARLALIRKQREDAAKKREEEKKAKEAAKMKGGKS